MSKCKLSEVFKKQRELNERVSESFYENLKTDSDKIAGMLRFELALRQESAELIDSMHWKWWKKGDTDWDNVKIELVDIFHFFVSMCTVAGMDSEELMDLYFKKNDLNHTRQDNGYKDGSYNKVIDGVEDNANLFKKK